MALFFQRYSKNLIKSSYTRLGHHTRHHDKHSDVLLRLAIAKWACDTELEECIDEAKEEFDSWMKGEDAGNDLQKHHIDVELRAQVYCTAVAQGGEKEWNFVWEKYKTNQIPSEQKKLLMALPCTKHIWLLNKSVNNCSLH